MTNQPTTLAEALRVIADLRARLGAWESMSSIEQQPEGVRPQSWRLYQFFKQKGFLTRNQIRQHLWGAKARSEKGIVVAVWHVRKLLPKDEVIIGIRGQGYAWKRVVPVELTRKRLEE